MTKWAGDVPQRYRLPLFELAAELAVADKQLEGKAWIMGDDYSIADIAIFPWVRGLVGFYAAGDLVGWDAYKNVARVLEAFVARPAVAKGLAIPG